MKIKNKMVDYEITLVKFLQIYFGVAPAVSKNITHEDVQQLFSTVESLTDRDFWLTCNHEDLLTEYVRVKDKNNIIMYYKRLELFNADDMQESFDLDYSDCSEIDYLCILLNNIDINNLSKYELCELKNKLKKIKKQNAKNIDKKITDINKRLRYMKRRNIK